MMYTKMHGCSIRALRLKTYNMPAKTSK